MTKHLTLMIACAFVSPLIATNAIAGDAIAGSSAGSAGRDGSIWSTTPQTSPAERGVTTPADATPPQSAQTDPTRPADATPPNGAHYLDPRYRGADKANEDYSRIRGAAGSVGPADPREFDPRGVDPRRPETVNGGPKETIGAPPVRNDSGSGGSGSIDLYR